MYKIEKIRQEIERRIALYSGWSNETVHPTRIDEDRQLLSFIDTLEEEPDKSLEEAAEKFANTQNKNFLNPEIVKNIFIAGTKWQEEQDEKLIALAKDSWYHQGLLDGKFMLLECDKRYQQGRSDMKEQMMKEVSEGTVKWTIASEDLRSSEYDYLVLDTHLGKEWPMLRCGVRKGEKYVKLCDLVNGLS
jgi:hypothetical protein